MVTNNFSSICLENNNNNFVTLDYYYYYFHATCLNLWLEKHKKTWYDYFFNNYFFILYENIDIVF